VKTEKRPSQTDTPTTTPLFWWNVTENYKTFILQVADKEKLDEKKILHVVGVPRNVD